MMLTIAHMIFNCLKYSILILAEVSKANNEKKKKCNNRVIFVIEYEERKFLELGYIILGGKENIYVMALELLCSNINFHLKGNVGE